MAETIGLVCQVALKAFGAAGRRGKGLVVPDDRTGMDKEHKRPPAQLFNGEVDGNPFRGPEPPYLLDEIRGVGIVFLAHPEKEVIRSILLNDYRDPVMQFSP
jgi:hypothetical protein